MQHGVVLSIKYTKYSIVNELDTGKSKQIKRALGQR